MAKYTWDDGQRSFHLSCLEENITLSVWYGASLADHVSISAPVNENEWYRFSFAVTSEN